MKNLVVKPSKIVTRGTAIHDVEKLNIYYQKFIFGKKVPPISIVSPNLYPIWRFKKDLEVNKLGLKDSDLEIELFDADKFEESLSYWMNHGAEYLICDGNHRSVAYALAELDIPTREVERFSDIKIIIKELGGSAPLIMHDSNSMKQYMFKLYRGLSKNTLYTLEGKVRQLQNYNELKLEKGAI